jgi:Flp pilus assembly protein TadG
VSGFVVSVFTALVAMAALAFDGTRLIAGHAEISDHAASAARLAAQEVIDIRLGKERIDPQAGRSAARQYLDQHGLTGHVQVDGLRVTVTIEKSVAMTLLSVVGISERVVATVRQVEVVDE